jgi:AmiR/NasT family two-component response regulator
MTHHRITQDAAFWLLRATSQTLQRKLRDVAERVVETGALPPGGPTAPPG